MLAASLEEEIWELVEQKDKAYQESFRELSSSEAIGIETRLTDEEFMMFFNEKAATTPGWVLALPFVDGGADWLKRWMRIQEKAIGGPRWQAPM